MFKPILFAIVLSLAITSTAFAGGPLSDVGTSVAGRSLYGVASNGGIWTYKIQRGIGGPVGRITADIADQAMGRVLTDSINRVGGPNPLAGRTEQLVVSETSGVIMNIFKGMIR